MDFIKDNAQFLEVKVKKKHFERIENSRQSCLSDCSTIVLGGRDQ